MPVYNFTIDDGSPFITYGGLWKDSDVTDPGYVFYLNGTFHSTQSPDSNASFVFNGTGVYLYGANRVNHSTYSVTLDGDLVANRNGAAKEDVYQTLLYGNSTLRYGTHQITLANTGAPSFMDLDYVIVTTGDGTTDTRSDYQTIDDVNFSYDTHWLNSANGYEKSYAGETEHRTNIPQAMARIPFTGNAIKLYSATSANHGMFSLSLDGAAAQVLNGTAPAFRPGTLLFYYDGLPSGSHILTVENLSNEFLDLDQAIVSTYTVMSNSTTPGAPASETSLSSTEPSKISSQTALIVGTVVGVLAFLLLVGIGIFFFLRRRYRKHARKQELVLSHPRESEPVGHHVPTVISTHVNPSLTQDQFGLPPSYEEPRTYPAPVTRKLGLRPLPSVPGTIGG